MLYAIFIIGVIFCGLLAIATKSLLASTVWLAAISAQVAMLMYLMGAHTVAVIELSVGAGLVTVLFVFAISTAGDETREPGLIARKFAILSVALAIIATTLLVWMILPAPKSNEADAVTGLTFSQTVWQQRSLDTLLQIVLISAGAMSVLGFVSKNHASRPPQKQLMLLHEEQAEGSTNGRSDQSQHARSEETAAPDFNVQEERI